MRRYALMFRDNVRFAATYANYDPRTHAWWLLKAGRNIERAVAARNDAAVTASSLEAALIASSI
jgi:hypothetical protein